MSEICKLERTIRSAATSMALEDVRKNAYSLHLSVINVARLSDADTVKLRSMLNEIEMLAEANVSTVIGDIAVNRFLDKVSKIPDPERT